MVRKTKQSKIVIVSYGSVLSEALDAAKILADEGIEADVVNARFCVPFDKQIILSSGKYKGIIAVEDHRRSCGFGSKLLEAATEENNTVPIRLVAMPEKFIGPDSRKAQLRAAGICADKIVEIAREMVKKD